MGMGRRGIVVLCMACVLALSGVTSASAMRVLELSTSEGALVPGISLNLGGITSFETPQGSVECPAGLFAATLLANNTAKDQISIDAGPGSGSNGIACTTTTPLGSVEVKAGGLPWIEQLAPSGKATLKGHKKLQLTVTVPLLAGLQCTYEAAKIIETFPLAANGIAVPLELTVTNQAFARSRTSNVLCPASIAINYPGVPVTIPGELASLIPVFVTRRVLPKA
jgi:hypothetical protein